MTGTVFFDSNVPLYLLSGDGAKAARAEKLLAGGGSISVQVLNEVVDVARRKVRADWDAIERLVATLRALCTVEALTDRVHAHAIALARAHGFRIFDANIVASALACKASTLYSEDFQAGRVIEGLVIRNPFRAA